MARRTWSPAIGGFQAGKEKNGDLRACTRCQRWRGSAGSRAGHQEAAKAGGREGDLLDLVLIPEVVIMGEEIEREVECKAREGCWRVLRSLLVVCECW